MIGKIVWGIIAAALVAWFVLTSQKNRAIEQQRIVAENAKEQLVRSKIESLAQATSANRNWVSVLENGEEFRFTPILTLELEKAWIEGGPILFSAVISDISTFSENKYKVDFEQGFLESIRLSAFTELKLSLIADKSYIDSFMVNNPGVRNDIGFSNGIAVAAKINSIESSFYIDQDNDKIEVKSGIGELLGLEFLGDVEL
jgi:hypothetical protein